MQYDDFIESKRLKFEPVGFDTPFEINPILFNWQADVTRWALRRGRAALFEDCGLGKTLQQVEWAQHVCRYTDGNALILAPLGVTWQTAEIAKDKMGIDITVCRTGSDVRPGINIANYERLHHFDAEDFSGIVLDESSILKAYDGIMRRQITEFGEQIPYRLACTATPAPNDLVELCNHAEFLGVMSENEVKALFFTQDGNSTQKWRLKGHAVNEFWSWMATWSVALRKPSDLGYSDDGFVLPACRVHQVTVDIDNDFSNGMLFAGIQAVGLSEQRASRKASLDDRVAATAELVNNSDASWLVWCDLNAESEALTKAIAGAVEVTGSDSSEFKEQSALDFAHGKIRVLISKPSIFGFGLNFQHCANVAFVGLSHSYEAYYQAIRRVWRFGQKQEVNAYIITSTADGAVVQNIERKEKQAMDMFDEIVSRMSIYTDVHGSVREEMTYREDAAYGPDWTLYLGDSVNTMRHIPDKSIGLSVFSPPFPGMYVYTNSPHDMGNVATLDQMIDQFRYLMDREHLYRIMMPGATWQSTSRN